jgi:membrane protein YdbS with pleckstrin-like domain
MLARAEEQICLDARRHGIVLLGPLLRAGATAAAGALCFAAGWPVSSAGAVLLLAAAAMAAGAVVRWDRTHVVVTTEKLFVVHGVFRRRAAAVRLARVDAVELEQSLLGRALGYGTLVAGELEIPFVPQPKEVYGLVARLGG